MAFLKTGPSLKVLKEASQSLCIEQIHPFFHAGILCLTVPPKTHSHREGHKDIVHRPKKPSSFLVQEYHALYGNSFNLLCMTCLLVLTNVQQLLLGGRHLALFHAHLHFTYTTHENNFLPFQSLIVIHLNSPIITSCSNVICAVHCYLNYYFQTGYLDCSTAEQRLHRVALS